MGGKKLFEILVPTEMVNFNTGKLKPIRTRYHRIWDKEVRRLSGGLTILTPAKGQWLDTTGTLIAERMIPVRFVATDEDATQIAVMTKAYYNQQKVLYYEVSNKVYFV